MPTSKLSLPTITDNMTADVVRDMNALANAVDAKAAVANGLATLGSGGKIPAAQIDVNSLGILKSQVGLSNVDNVKQEPIQTFALNHLPMAATPSQYKNGISVFETDTTSTWVINEVNNLLITTIKSSESNSTTQYAQSRIWGSEYGFVRYGNSVTNTFGTWQEDFTDLQAGKLIDLTTTAKTNLVAAINEVNTHKSNSANPHNTTKAQVGLGNVDNVKQEPLQTFALNYLPMSATPSQYRNGITIFETNNTSDWVVGGNLVYLVIQTIKSPTSPSTIQYAHSRSVENPFSHVRYGSDTSNTFSAWQQVVTDTQTGKLTSLTTSNKTNLVAAINEKQTALPAEQRRRIFIQTAAPTSPQENDIWIEV